MLLGALLVAPVEAKGKPDNTPPTASITSPGSGTTYTSPLLVTITVSASDDVGVTKIEFFDGGAASAQAVAHEDCEILAIPHGEIRALMASRPEIGAKFLWAFARTLAARLRDDNQRMASVLAISRTF